METIEDKLKNFLNGLSKGKSAQVMHLSQTLVPAGIAPLMEDDPVVWTNVGFTGEGTPTIEQTARYFKAQIDREENNLALRLDASNDLKNTLGERFEEYKGLLTESLRTNYTNFVLNGNGIGLALHAVEECAKNLQRGAAKEAVAKTVQESLDRILVIFDNKSCYRPDDTDELINGIYEHLQQPPLSENQVREQLEQSGFSMQLHRYVGDLPYKKGIALQTVVDKMYDSYKEHYPELTKELMKKLAVEEYGKMKTARIENGNIYRNEHKATDTFFPFEWAADLVQKHVPVSYEIAAEFKLSKEQADQERYEIAAQIVAAMERTFTQIYYDHTNQEDNTLELKKDAFEAILYEIGDGPHISMMLGDRVSILDRGDDGDGFKRAIDKCYDELKAQLYSRLDKGHKVKFFDPRGYGVVLTFEKSGENIKIRYDHKDPFEQSSD